MKVRKSKDIQKVLLKKSFKLYPEKDHHQFYYLTIDDVKYPIYTYFSHGKKEYNKSLMAMLKKQLKFQSSEQAEDFFDCPMSAEQYIELLISQNDIIISE